MFALEEVDDATAKLREARLADALEEALDGWLDTGLGADALAVYERLRAVLNEAG
jgi:hypothetical protein